MLPSYQQRELLELAVKSCKALGLQIVSEAGRRAAGCQGSQPLQRSAGAGAAAPQLGQRLPRCCRAAALARPTPSCTFVLSFPPAPQGVFHVEGKYTSRGPRLIEVNCRMVRARGRTRLGCLCRLGAAPRPRGRCLCSAVCRFAGSRQQKTNSILRYTQPHPCTPDPRLAPPCASCPSPQGGGPVRTMNLLAWGVDLVEEQLLASAGALLWLRCLPSTRHRWPQLMLVVPFAAIRQACQVGSAFFACRLDYSCIEHPTLRSIQAPTCTPRPRPAGIPSRPNVAARPLRNIAEYSVNALRTGTLKDTSFLDKCAERFQELLGFGQWRCCAPGAATCSLHRLPNV